MAKARTRKRTATRNPRATGSAVSSNRRTAAAPRPQAPQRRPQPSIAGWAQERKPIELFIASSALLILLYAVRVIDQFGLLLFLLAVMGATGVVLKMALETFPARDRWRGGSKILFLVLVVLVPIFFDTSTSDTFNLPKYTLVVISATVLGLIWIMRAVQRREWSMDRTLMAFPVLALLAWAIVTTATSTNVRMSLLGVYDDYEGLYLMIAMTVIFFAAYLTFRLRDIRAVLMTFFVAGTGLEIVYGVVQLHDQVFGGSKWDWVHWAPITFSGAIWSGFGNPNHFGGYLAMMLPLGVVLLITAASTRARVIIGAVTVISFFELALAASRGAFVAVLLALGLTGILCVLQSPRRLRLAAISAGVFFGLAALAAGAIASSSFARQRFSNALNFGASNTITQRVELAKSAIKMADNRPLLGQGPDMFQSHFPHYQTVKFVQLYTANQIGNEPHNVFANFLATEGYPGLALWLVVLITSIMLIARTWRRLRARAETSSGGGNQLFLLIGISAALLGFVAQATFDPLQVGSVFCFWVLLGLLAVIGRDVGVTATLRSKGKPPHTDEPPNETYWRDVETAGGTVGRSKNITGRHLAIVSAAFVVVGSVAGLLIAGEVGPYRADHDYYVVLQDQSNASTAELTSTATADENNSLVALRAAIAANPWEPTYEDVGGQAYLGGANSPGTSASIRKGDLKAALSYFQAAVKLDPNNPVNLDAESGVLIELAVATKNPTYRTRAIAAERAAITAEPLDPQYPEHLKTVESTKV